MSTVRYSRQHEDEVIYLYSEVELSLAEIYNETGVLPQTAHKILVRRGIPRRPVGVGKPRPRIPTNELLRTAWLHRQGLTWDQMSHILGIGESGIKHRLRVARQRVGYRPRPRSRNGSTAPTAIPRRVSLVVASWR